MQTFSIKYFGPVDSVASGKIVLTHAVLEHMCALISTCKVHVPLTTLDLLLL